MKWLLAALVLIVLAVHQDSWFWKDRTLVFGFLPVGLAYHLFYCLLASLTMWALVRFAWPRELDDEEAGVAAAEGRS